MFQAWRRGKVITWAGYILGFPGDTAGSSEDIKTINGNYRSICSNSSS